jgi:GNAT superfamily N-acetyltransferase
MTSTEDAMTSTEDLLALHDEQIRGAVADRLPQSWQPTWDGPAMLVTAPAQGMVFARDLDHLTVPELDALIARARDHFAARGQSVEWKTYGHDRADLTGRLALAGFAPDPRETVVIGPAAALVEAGSAPDGVTISATTDPADLRAIAAMESAVWNADWSWLADDLADRIRSAPDDLVILTAKAGDQVVSAAWLVVMPGTRFAALWGGSTLAEWRQRGIYRALVARRARIAVERGIDYLMVEASDDSRPILERLGLRPVTTTTPWIWRPPSP